MNLPETGNWSVIASGLRDSSGRVTRIAIISKLNTDLTTLLASTFLGGTEVDDAAAIALDGDNNVFVAGLTASFDYPTTGGAFDATFNGIEDAFVAQLDSDLGILFASTFVGGSDFEDISKVALDENGNLLVTGTTGSSDYPTTLGAFDTTFNGAADVFVFRITGTTADD